MSNLEIVIGTNCHDYAEKADERRTRSQNRRYSSISRKMTITKKQNQLESNELFEEKENIYDPGIAD